MKFFHVVGFLIALDSTIEDRSPDFTSTSADYLSEDNSTTLVLSSEFTPTYHMVSSSILPLLKSSTSFDEATTFSTGSITLCRYFVDKRYRFFFKLALYTILESDVSKLKHFSAYTIYLSHIKARITRQ